MPENIIHGLSETFCAVDLVILDSNQQGVTGLSPTVRIQRNSDELWSDFDDSSFKAVPVTPTVVMLPVDAIKAPGLYRYVFTRADWGESGEEGYTFVYHNAAPATIGDDSDVHRWVKIAAGDVCGQYQVTVYVKEDTTLAAIVGCDVDIWNGVVGVVGSVRYVRKTTDSLGRVIVWLDAGTYRVYLSDPTHTAFSVPELLVVSGNGSTTFRGNAFNPGHSPSTSIRIYSWEYKADGHTPVVGATLWTWPTAEGSYTVSGGVGHREQKMSIVTDSDGYWYIDVVPGMSYEWDMKATRGKTFMRIVTSEDVSSVQFEDLL